jgi:hypothetical protein
MGKPTLDHVQGKRIISCSPTNIFLAQEMQFHQSNNLDLASPAHPPSDLRPVRSAYQPPASSTFLSERTSHQQPASSTLLSEQTSTSHQPPANRTGCWLTSLAEPDGPPYRTDHWSTWATAAHLEQWGGQGLAPLCFHNAIKIYLNYSVNYLDLLMLVDSQNHNRPTFANWPMHDPEFRRALYFSLSLN